MNRFFSTPAHPEPCRSANRTLRAFTLIELLVSMTILIIMTMIIAKIIADSSRAVEMGYQQAMMDGNARAFLDNVMDDLNQAIAVEGMPMKVMQNDVTTYDGAFRSDTLLFRALLGPDSTCDRAVKLVRYDVDGYDDYHVLRRGEKCANLSGENVPNIYPLMDYVVQFKFKMYALDENNQIRETTETLELPQYAELMLMVVSDKIHQRAMRMTGGDRQNFLTLHGRRYYVQATFPMAEGRWAEFEYYEE